MAAAAGASAGVTGAATSAFGWPPDDARLGNAAQLQLHAQLRRLFEETVGHIRMKVIYQALGCISYKETCDTIHEIWGHQRCTFKDAQAAFAAQAARVHGETLDVASVSRRYDHSASLWKTPVRRQFWRTTLHGLDVTTSNATAGREQGNIPFCVFTVLAAYGKDIETLHPSDERLIEFWKLALVEVFKHPRNVSVGLTAWIMEQCKRALLPQCAPVLRASDRAHLMCLLCTARLVSQVRKQK
jgi:hypothetical protein